jgi:hypothetical protein
MDVEFKARLSCIKNKNLFQKGQLVAGMVCTKIMEGPKGL